jgi:twitching motility two-component system response regulator PilH
MKARILIVEDSPTQAAVIGEIVKRTGHVPVIYNELSAGIGQILLREQPDLVLLDLRLLDADGQQVADGFQICREIKRSPRSPAVVVVSAEADEEAKEWALMQGADAFLQKPFAVQDLTAVIGQVLGK